MSRLQLVLVAVMFIMGLALVNYRRESLRSEERATTEAARADRLQGLYDRGLVDIRVAQTEAVSLRAQLAAANVRAEGRSERLDQLRTRHLDWYTRALEICPTLASEAPLPRETTTP